MPNDVRPPGSPWTVLGTLQWTRDYFKRHDIENPRADAEILLAHALRCRRIDLYLRFDQPLHADELGRFRELIRRRIHREPVAYILGEKEFWSLSFKVDRSVLIPRPETEILVEEVLRRMSSQVDRDLVRVLELGTGSGAISIALARERSMCRIMACDLSAQALSVASENARTHQVLGQVTFWAGRWFEALKEGASQWDIVMSNPPYIRSSDVARLAPEIHSFEPLQALDGGSDGLREIAHIIEQAPVFIVPGGFLILEIGCDQHNHVEAIAKRREAYDQLFFTKDYSGRFRVICLRRAFNHDEP